MKILVDISLGGISQGLGGIPQDSRWLFKTLTELKQFETSALIYDTDNSVHTIRKTKGFFPQSQFFAGFYSAISVNDFLMNQKKWFRVLYYIYSLYFKNNFDVQKAHDYLKPLIFRKYLAKGSMDFKLTNNDFYLYFGSLGSLFARTINNLKPPRMNTKDFDFVIFQDVKGFKVSSRTTKIIRYHDSIPITDLDVMANSKLGSIQHYREIEHCVKDGSIFVTNSLTVNRKLRSLFPKLEGRVYTIPYAISDKFYPEKKKIPFKYVLHVATIEPRKNQINMMKAYKKFSEKFPKVKLVIVGQKGWNYEAIEKEMETLQKDGASSTLGSRLLYIPGLTPDELRVFYSNAEMFLFPSYNEGFGLPPIEAMQCGCPVLSSNIDVHVELQKEAATYCDPYSVSDIADKMIYIMENSNYTKNKVALGLKIASKYSNEKAKENWSYLLTNLHGEKK